MRVVRVAPAGQDKQYPWHVHSSVPEQFAWLDAVARRTRGTQLRNVLKLQQVTPEGLAAEIEAFASTDWRPRPRSWPMRVPG